MTGLEGLEIPSNPKVPLYICLGTLPLNRNMICFYTHNPDALKESGMDSGVIVLAHGEIELDLSNINLTDVTEYRYMELIQEKTDLEKEYKYKIKCINRKLESLENINPQGGST